MFTGLIEEVGKIVERKVIPGGIALTISVSQITSEMKIGDSISVNGTCLTVTKFSATNFTVDAVGETLKKTALAKWKIGEPVNLERALTANDKLGGHVVQGHVAGIGAIREIKKMGLNYSISVEVDYSISKYFIHEGSVAIDGISLTIAKVANNRIMLSVIPHTWMNTNLRFKKVGSLVNIEPDVFAKYAENFMKTYKIQNEILSEDKLIKMGY